MEEKPEAAGFRPFVMGFFPRPGWRLTQFQQIDHKEDIE
jgi:hypothetical protein